MLKRNNAKKTAQTTVGIDLQSDGVALAVARAGGAGGVHTACEFIPVSAGESVPAALAGAVNKRGLRDCPAVLLLPAGEYSLLQTQTPPLSRDEMRAAARWKIGDLIDFPLEQAVVDAFELPESGQRGTDRLLYAVAARAGDVQAHVDQVRAANLDLQAIDIGEMALRNVVARMPENDTGVAVLCLAERHGSLAFIKQDELYLTRRLEMGFDDLMHGDEKLYDEIVLELQRSLDYFESHFAQALPSKLLMFPPDKLSGELILHINSHLNIEAEPLLLEKLAGHSIEADEESQARCLWAVGATLRDAGEAPAR